MVVRYNRLDGRKKERNRVNGGIRVLPSYDVGSTVGDDDHNDHEHGNYDDDNLNWIEQIYWTL